MGSCVCHSLVLAPQYTFSPLQTEVLLFFFFSLPNLIFCIPENILSVKFLLGKRCQKIKGNCTIFLFMKSHHISLSQSMKLNSL